MKKTSDFETEMAELESLLSQLNDESTSLEDAVTLYAKAAEKLAKCTKTLQDAKLRVEKIDEVLTKTIEE